MAKPGLNGAAYRKLRQYMKDHWPWVCHRCREPISREITAQNPRARMAWSADHFPIPRSQGGPTTLANLKPAHNKCNSDAGLRLPREPSTPEPVANPSSQDWGI